MAKITGAQITVRLLEQQGIKVVAGIPGGSTLPLYDELAKSSLKHILVRHEQAAGFFAQGISRTKDEVGVCLATSGPGAMNLLTAIADARADSIALVAITGQVNSSLIGTDAFQEADTFGLSFPITKHSILVKSAEELISAIPLAFTIARSGRKGPVLIDIPRDVQLQSVDIELPSDIDTSSKLCTKYATSEEDFAEKIAKTAELIQKRSDVVLYIGGGCNNPETAFAVKAFLDVCPMPTVTSLMGIGCIPFDHPCNCGMIGMHGTMTANRVMHDADLVLAIGTRFDDRATGLIAKFCPKATIVHVDVDAAEVNKIFSADIAIVGEAQGFFTALTKTVQKQGIKGVDITEYTKLRRAEFEKACEKSAPGRFIASVPALVGEAGIHADDIIVVTDVGQHQMWTAAFYPVCHPRQFLTSGSLGTMGFGLPVAIGAAYANPGKRIICFSGDGSIMMNIQELATLAELQLDVTVIVLDNGVLGMVRQQQHFLFNDNFSASIFERSPDLSAIAKSFGIISVDTSVADWHKVAFVPPGEGPRFVVCKIDENEMVYPFVPGSTANIDAIES